MSKALLLLVSHLIKCCLLLLTDFSGGTVGYCAQSAWIQNATLKDNVVFGQPWNEERYLSALRDACLEPDLAVLPDGDMTEIGEKGESTITGLISADHHTGINLSGGQKQRVNIARALYFDSDIVALDDPLSAVDAHVGKYLFDHAIKGSLAGRTRLVSFSRRCGLICLMVRNSLSPMHFISCPKLTTYTASRMDKLQSTAPILI